MKVKGSDDGSEEFSTIHRPVLRCHQKSPSSAGLEKTRNRTARKASVISVHIFPGFCLMAYLL